MEDDNTWMIDFGKSPEFPLRLTPGMPRRIPMDLFMEPHRPDNVNGVGQQDVNDAIRSNMSSTPINDNERKRPFVDESPIPNEISTPKRGRTDKNSDDDSAIDVGGDEDAPRSNFTIYRINIPKVEIPLENEEKVDEKTTNEQRIIHHIIKESNTKRFGSKVEDKGFKLDSTHNETFNFRVEFYMEITKTSNGFLRRFKKKEENVNVNNILFYHQTDEIFAVCTTQTWNLVQVHCWENFCVQISNRMASTDGSFRDNYLKLTGNTQSATQSRRTESCLNDMSAVKKSNTKMFRDNASIYRLTEFEGRNRNLRAIFGTGSIRFERKITVQNIPEILNHFALICNGGTTKTYDGEDEIDIEEQPPMLTKVLKDKHKEQNQELVRMIYEFVMDGNNEVIAKFSTSHNHAKAVSMCKAKKFVLKNGSGRKGKRFHKFDYYPNCFQVLSTLQGNDLFTKTDLKSGISKFEQFSKKLKKVYLTCTGIRNTSDCGNSLLKLLEGGINDFWKLKERWFKAQDYFHLWLQDNFSQTLLTNDIILKRDDQGYLYKLWDKTMTVSKYVAMYKSETNFIVPSADSTFDLMRFYQPEVGKGVVHLYYIFDGFNGTFMDASMRVNKTLNGPKPEQGSKFLHQHVTKHHKSVCDIFVVLAFLPNHSREVDQAPGEAKLTEMWTREKNLLKSFNEENVKKEIVDKLNPISKEWIQAQPDFQVGELEKTFIKKLLDKGYCTDGNSECKLVSGKLLKIKWHADFKLFKDKPEVNKEVYCLIEEKWLSRFSSVTHKMECEQVKSEVSECKDKNVTLKFTEVPLNTL